MNPRARAARLTLALLSLLGCSGEPEAAPEPRYEFGCPDAPSLACTGLYGPVGEHWYSKRVASGVRPFKPVAELWSDGMHKQRWAYLPEGTSIDGRDPDHWAFPVGTKLWKEFSWQGKRIETRYLEKRGAYWHMTTYRWSDDQLNALELTAGELAVPGTPNDSYEVPPTSACARCHGGAADGVLGMGAVLSSAVTVPGTALEREALTYLHVNCGVSCHQPATRAEAWWTGLYLRLETDELTTVAATAAYRTGVGKPSYISSPSDPNVALDLIAPGRPEQSAVVYRDRQRGNLLQMPPLATHQVDDQGVALIERWIREMAP